MSLTGRRIVTVLILLPALSMPLLSGPTVSTVEAAAPGAPRAWVLPAMARVTPTAEPRHRSTAVISAARGETESFQVAVHARGGRLTSATVVLSNLAGPGSASISSRRLVRYREHFVRIRDDEHSPSGSGKPLQRQWFPDALIPFVDPTTGKAPTRDARYAAAPFGVSSGRTQPVWIDVRVPRRAPAGIYTGTWKVTSDQGSVSGRVRLRVWDFAVPATPAQDTSFGTYRRHQQTRTLLLDHDIQPTPVNADRETFLRTRGLRSVNLGLWSDATVHDCTMKPPPTVAVIRRAAERHNPALRIYNYTADEISDCEGLDARLRTWGRRLHRAGVEQLVTMVPEPGLLDDGTGVPAVDIWPILPIQFRRDLDPDVRAEVLDRGGEMWSYQALVQGARTPSWQIDFPAANYRILPGFLNQRMGVTGTLYWTVDYWQPHPWRNVVNNDFGCCFPGDGMLVYPGRQAGVVGTVPSIRLAWIRDGVDDFAYVEILRERGLAAQAMSIIDPAAHSWRRWTQSRDVIADARDELAAAIEASNP